MFGIFFDKDHIMSSNFGSKAGGSQDPLMLTCVVSYMITCTDRPIKLPLPACRFLRFCLSPCLPYVYTPPSSPSVEILLCSHLPFPLLSLRRRAAASRSVYEKDI